MFHCYYNKEMITLQRSILFTQTYRPFLEKNVLSHWFQSSKIASQLTWKVTLHDCTASSSDALTSLLYILQQILAFLTLYFDNIASLAEYFFSLISEQVPQFICPMQLITRLHFRTEYQLILATLKCESTVVSKQHSYQHCQIQLII